MVTMTEALRSIDILKNISPKSMRQLTEIASLRKIGKGQHLFRDKEEVDTLYAVVSGRASLYKINSMDDKKVIFVYGPGNMLNEVMLQDLPASINCEMLADSFITAFPVDRFWRVMEQDSELTRAFIQSMALKIRRLYRQLKNTTNSLNGEKRLAAKLYKLAKDYGVPDTEGTRIDMTLTITYLAEMLGSKRETVSRQAKKLVELELIVIKKQQIIILDTEKLSKYFKSP